MSRRVVVVGGGVCGLTAAYRLLARGPEARDEGTHVVVLEAQNRLGGAILTERREGLVLDGGADSIDMSVPQAAGLLADLGLEDEVLVTPDRNRRVYVRRAGVLHTLPEGLIPNLPNSVGHLVAGRLLTLSGKARLGLEAFLPRRPGFDDESVGSFFRRRFGREVTDRVAEPLVGCVYAGDIDSLSLLATAPALRELEQRQGSVIRRALTNGLRSGGLCMRICHPSPPPPRTASLLGGLGRLVEVLGGEVTRRGGEIRLSAAAASIARGHEAQHFAVTTQDGRSFAADSVLLCVPSWAAATLVEGLDAGLATTLRRQTFASVATILMAYARPDVPPSLCASEILLPRSERRRSLRVALTTNRWPGRAPSDVVVFRVMVGGTREPRAIGLNDSELSALARAELEVLLGIRARPILARVYRFDRALAQPAVGHDLWLADVHRRSQSHPGLYLGGACLAGVSVAQGIEQGIALSQALLQPPH